MLFKPNRNHKLEYGKSGIITVLLLLIIPLSTNSQEWIRIYGDNISCYAYSLIESYDKGYVYAGKINQDQIPKYGWIFKTDINGEMLWDKKFGEYGDVTAVHDIKQTIDNGYILSGSTKKLDPYYDPFIMKLNVCGEKEWCKILHLPNNMDFGTRILQLPNGNYIALLTYFSYIYSERIWLMCFDEAGEVLWKKVYAQEYPFIDSENGYGLLTTSDSSILITGKCYYPDLPDTTTYIARHFLIKTDFEGNEKWTLIWGSDEQFYGHGVMSVEDNNGNIYTVGRHTTLYPNFGYSPTLTKTSIEGEEIFYSDVYDSTNLGLSTTISWFNDSTLVIGTGWSFPGQEIVEAVIKVDTSGNVLITKILIETDNTFQGSIVDFDNKCVLMGGFYLDGNWDIYAYKFNQDLEYDTIYTQPFVYDSLCPYPIVSDTIPLDCEVVGLEDQKTKEQPRLTIIPNPAKDKIRVVLPEHITTHSKAAGFSVTTWRYQFNGEIQLEIYDMYGRRWHQQVVAKGDKEAEIPVSSLPTGLYVVRAVIDGKVVSGKFVKQ